MKSVEHYLTMFNGIPDDIILGMATEEIDVKCPYHCIVGIAFRYVVAKRRKKDVDSISGNLTYKEIEYSVGLFGEQDIMDICVRLFGNSEENWSDLYLRDAFPSLDDNAVSNIANMEEAFAERLNGIVS